MSGVTPENRAQMYAMVAKMSAEKLVQALKGDVFPDEDTEKIFGIVMSDTANDGIGDLIYRAYSDIYKRRLFYGSEETSVLRQFEKDLASALTSAKLAPTFKEWMQQVIDDQHFPLGGYCRQLKARGLNFDFVIHPTNTEHREWMERVREEFGEGAPGTHPSSKAAAAASTIHSTTASSARANAICKHCGKEGAVARCSACKEFSYCSKRHQKADWKQHKPCCQGIIADSRSIWIEVSAGEGNGLCNTMMNHIFPNKEDGWNYVKQDPEFAHGNTIGPLRSPFSELVDWSVEIYCSKAYNHLDGPSRVHGNGPLNGAGIYLTSSINTGMSVNVNLSGRIFVTGRRQSDGKPLTSDVLWGILNLIWDAMDLYGESDPVWPYLKSWANAYKAGTWEPGGGGGGIDVFCTDPERLRSNQKLVHGP
jgi:hypothetical protein